jgi:hypothetical protein
MTDPSPIPAPVTPLEYSYATQRGRPGIITAIGVISIIVACLSGLGSLWGAFGAGTYYMMSKMPAATLAPPVATTIPTTNPTATPTTGTTTQGVTMQFTNVVVGPGGTMTTTTTPGGAPAVMGNPFGSINPVAAILSLLAELLSLGLAIFLLVAGIQTLRDSPSGAKLHRWYALLKIPLVIVATGVGLWLTTGMMKSIMASMPPGAGGAPGPQAAFMWSFIAARAIIPACLALAYPVALIFVLRSRSVRDFYNTVRDDDLPRDSFDTRRA